jgi:hypothetical protein
MLQGVHIVRCDLCLNETGSFRKIKPGSSVTVLAADTKTRLVVSFSVRMLDVASEVEANELEDADVCEFCVGRIGAGIDETVSIITLLETPPPGDAPAAERPPVEVAPA